MLTHSYHWLVTGSAGFIGSHIVKELVQQGQKVTVPDNLSGGKLDNLSPVQDRITFIQGDICDFDTVKNLSRR